MKRLKKVLLAVLGVVLLVPVVGVTALKLKKPAVSPLWTERIEATPERLARGRYLAQHVTVCIDCHSQRDWSRFAGPVMEGSVGGGGERFGHDVGFPGEVESANITPDRAHGVGAWSDGELVRAIREGVRPDGRVLAPLMPYKGYRYLSDEDVRSIVVFLRTLAPSTRARTIATTLDMPLSLLAVTIPQPAGANGHVAEPNRADPVRYGAYLVQVAGCAECHTPSERGEPVAGMYLAGGFAFQFPRHTVRSANLTPHATGLGAMTEAQFIGRFRAAALADGATTVPANPRAREVAENNTVMPWTMYAGMTDDDLRAIYQYLRTVPAVENRVQRTTPR